MESVDIMLAGRVLPGTDPNQAAADFARICGLDVQVVLAAITSGQPRPAMQGLTPEHGRAWLTRMTAIGLEASLRASTVPADKSFGPPPETPTQPQPQATPQPQPAGTGRGRWLDKARKVPAGHGWTWIRDSWRLIREQPKVWCGVLAIMSGLGALMYVPLLYPLLVPFFCDMAITAHRQLAGEHIRLGDLVAYRGKEHRKNRTSFEGIGIGIVVYVPAVLAAIAGVAWFTNMSGVTIFETWISERRFPVWIDGEGFGGPFSLMVYRLLLVGGGVAVVLHAVGGKRIMSAIRKGLCGGLKNWPAFLVWWLVMIVVCMPAFCIALLAGITYLRVPGTLPEEILGIIRICDLAGDIGDMMTIPGLLYVGLVASISPLTAYMAARDMFYEE